ncbi:MAG: O-antigen ligase family protein [Planctomycetota bacterium]
MLTPFLENLSLVLVILGITLRPFIPSSQVGLGFGLFINLFIWSGFFLWLANHARRNELKIIHPGRGAFFIIIFGLLTLASPLIASYKLAALPYSADWLTDLILFFFIIGLAPMKSGLVDESKKNTVIHFFILSLISTAIVITAYAVYQYYNLDTLKEFLARNPDLIASLPPELMNEFFNRLNANEPFATFIYQNSLAGWLVLLWPVWLGLLPSFSLEKNRFALVLNIIFLLVMAFIIYATGAKGAWVAFIMSLLIFGLLAGWSRLTKFYRIISGSVLFIIFFGIFLVFLLALSGKISLQAAPDCPAWGGSDFLSSLQIRFNYWQGAWQIIKENLWFGVGLDNFGSHYLQFKDAVAGETSKAHNDFLQIWAELGIFGIIAFLGSWFIILLKPIRTILNPTASLKQNETTASPISEKINPRSLSRTFIIGAALAFLISQLLAGTFQLTDELPWLAALIFFILWMGFFLINQDSIPVINTKYLRCGIIAGLAGLFIHSAVDFDWYSPVISQSAWLLGGCLMALTHLSPIAIGDPLPVRRGGGTEYRTLKIKNTLFLRFFIILLFLLLAVGGLVIIPKLMEAHQLLMAGRDKIHASSAAKIQEGYRDLERAKELNPTDAAPWEILAWFYHSNLCLPLEHHAYEKMIKTNQVPKNPGIKLLDETFQICLKHIDRAIELRPLSSALQSGRGVFYEDHAGIINSWLATQPSLTPTADIQPKANPSSGGQKLKQSSLGQSLHSFRKAYRLYPTRPVNAYRLARAIENQQLNSGLQTGAGQVEAKELYQRALELDGLVLQKELKLPPEVREEIKEKLKQ